MKTKLFLFLYLTFSSTSLIAQSPYVLEWNKEPYYLGFGVGSYLTGSMVYSNKGQALTIQEINRLNPSSINAFDLRAISNLSASARNGSDIGLFGSYIFPMLFLTNERSRSEFGKIAILYSETFSITLGLTKLAKRSVLRTRPFVFDELAPINKKQTRNARHSFFSGHTSMSAANCFFAAKVFSDYFPDSSWKPVVWGAAVLVPATTGYLRVKAGKHFPTDVITGFVVGGAIGVLVPHLHKVKKDNRLTVYPNPNGVLLRFTL